MQFFFSLSFFYILQNIYLYKHTTYIIIFTEFLSLNKMDYFQNYSNINDTVPDEDTLTLERIIPSYQQQLPLTYPYNNEFQSRATNRNEIQLSNNDISNNGMQQVPEQSWNTHSILDSMTNETISCNNNEDLTQPERGIAGFVSKLYQ